MEINTSFWKDRSIFLTGHTGFKGSWIALWLTKMGAKVHGYSLDVEKSPNMFTEAKLREKLSSSTIADIQNISTLKSAMSFAKPTVIIHMAAQSLVKKSYEEPVQTFKTNIIGVVNLLEVARKVDTVEAIINVTSDKCYESKEYLKPFQENDKLGGYDPYSSSKACAELISSAYRNSFLRESGIKIATVRAGNVIGGGDWANNRLIPDFLRASDNSNKLYIRSPDAIRPWQHVLNPISGYLMLVEKLVTEGNNFAEAWNFGPQETDSKSVLWVINYLSQKFSNVQWEIDKAIQHHETSFLLLDSSKANSKLCWKSRWPLETALDKIIEWHQDWKENKAMDEISISQINSFCNND